MNIYNWFDVNKGAFLDFC